MMRVFEGESGGRLLLGGLFLLFLIGIAGAVATTGWDATLAALERLSPIHVVLLLALSLGNYGLRALRWHLMARAMALPTGFIQDMRHYIAGFALTATPGRVGEFVRLRWLSRETGWSIDRVAPIALADRAAELAAIAPLIALSVGLSALGSDVVWPLVAISLAIAFVSTRPRLLRAALTLAYRMTGMAPRLFVRLRRVTEGLTCFSRAGVALPAIALGLIGWFCEGAAFAILLDLLGAPVPLWTAVAIFLIAMLSGAFAGLPGGLGGAEAAMVGLLLLQGVPAEIAIPATAIIRVTTLWFAILLGMGVFPWAEAQARKATARAA